MTGAFARRVGITRSESHTASTQPIRRVGGLSDLFPTPVRRPILASYIPEDEPTAYADRLPIRLRRPLMA